MFYNYKYGDDRQMRWEPEFRFRGERIKTRVDADDEEDVEDMVALASVDSTVQIRGGDRSATITSQA